VNRKKLYPDDTSFTLGWGGKKPLTLPLGTSLESALLAAKKKELALMEAPVQPAAAVVEIPRLRLDDAAQAYLDWVTKNRPKSLVHYRGGVMNFLEGCEKKYLDEIGIEDLENYRDDMLDEFEGGTVQCRLDYVCTFINRHDSQVFPNLTMLKKNKRVPLTLRYNAAKEDVLAFSPEQYDRLYAARTQDEQIRWATLPGVGYRKNEMSHAEYSDIRGQSISIKAKPEYNWQPKSKAGTRLVTVPSSLLAMLEKRRREHPGTKLIFPGDDGKPQTGGKLLHSLETRALKTGLNCGMCEGRRYDGKTVSCREAPVCSVWKLHRFRASFATDHYNSGKISELQIMAFLGHTDFKITQRYLALAKANDPKLIAAVNSTWAIDSRLAVGA
jgi:integrase